MNKFFIKKLIVSGKGNSPSVIDFSEGLNIICGPSDTGKSYVVECINYLFGSSEVQFDRSAGYSIIKLIVETPAGSVAFERKIDTKKITVSSTDPSIESDVYKLGTGQQSISSVWLKLIGIHDEHFIVKSRKYEKQHLSWRTFLHMFMIDELRIPQKSSILLPTQRTSDTAALSSLLFLITGKDFSAFDSHDDKKIKEAKKKAVIAYINGRLASLAERKNELDETQVMDTHLIQSKVEEVLDEIAQTEEKISRKIKQNQRLLEELFSLNEQLAECNTLCNRYQDLRSQYTADIKRLTFIVEGELHSANLPHSSKCPFCENSIPDQDEPTYIEASKSELASIVMQLEDLKAAERDIVSERLSLEARIAELTKEKANVDALVNNELKPKLATLKQALWAYRQAIEVHNEVSIITGFETNMKSQLFEMEMEDDSDSDFKIKSYFDSDILSVLDQCLCRILKICKFDGLSLARLSPSNFDIVINGKEKSNYGKGYRAYLNTVLALTMMEYLIANGQHAPRLLIVDSPILSLKERGKEKASDSMKAALFQYFVDNQSNGQIIIIENDIPELDYSNANVVRFTKDTEQGRYGFLNGVR